MMIRERYNKNKVYFLIFILPSVLVGYTGCSSNNSDNANPTVNKFDLPVNESVKDVELIANQPTYIKHHYQAIPDSFQELKIDLAKTLGSISVQTSSQTGSKVQSITGRADDDISAQVMMYLGSEDQGETVCESDIKYGPITFEADSTFKLLSVNPPFIDLTQKSLSIVNIGSFHLCVEVISPVDATLNANSISIETQDCQEPDDIDGFWTGTYTCTNSCDPSSDDEVRNISLTVAQSGTSAIYFDDEAKFSGTVCGNIFKFEGGSTDIGYTESGVFTLNADGTATKTSSWIDSEQCRGDCKDSLHQ